MRAKKIYPCLLSKQIRVGRWGNIFIKYLIFKNSERVCQNEKWKYIHRVRYVDEDLEFPKVFVLLINVLSIQQQENLKLQFTCVLMYLYH